MFNGIITEIGLVKNIKKFDNKYFITINANKIIQKLDIGKSVAVNGVCLTVISIEYNSFSVDAIKNTLDLTNLSYLKLSDKVNLEPATKHGDDISGHYVTGHVDNIGIIKSISQNKDYKIIYIEIPKELNKYLVKKGSVAIDGISLTINECKNNLLKVAIIPHSLENTTLKYKNIGHQVNIETDIMAKYFENYQSSESINTINKKKLIQNGFI